VNFTAEFPGGYTSDQALALVDQLAQQYGVNAIALVPYGFASQDRPEIRFDPNRTMERDEGIVAVTARAKERGMQVLLKPQLWSRQGFPGSIDMKTPDDVRAWFTAYTPFLEHYANLATRIHADMYSIGVEFVRMSRHDKQWREMAARARQHFAGPLVYCATQGEEFEQHRFFDAVDYIGLNNYYPLPDSLDTSAMVAKVEQVQKRFGRPVIFPEAGYCSMAAPHREPWAEDPRAIALDEQARCYEALLKAFWRKPWFQGIYWWKVGTNGRGGPNDGSHTPWKKPAMEVVKRWFTKETRN
jgi:hypothetical protein